MAADEIDRLYALPLDRFTAERDELARRLRKEGRRDEAEAVKRLRKPSVAAWAVNRLARERKADVRALLAAAERLRRAHGAGPAEFREAAAAEREALGRLVTEARAVLEEAGRRPTEATVNAVARTLQAAAADEREREALERGRLDRELEPGGFEALAGVAADASAGPASGKGERRDGHAAKRRVDEARARVAAASARARELRTAADAAERAAKKARAEADRARAEADRAEEEVDRAEERLAAVRGGR